MTFIWATRGEAWGFRFLRDGGFTDPLPQYDSAFEGTPTGQTAWQKANSVVAARFPDPDGRTDSAGRVIPHEFVLFPPLADELDNVDDVITQVWPLVADEYSDVWQTAQP